MANPTCTTTSLTATCSQLTNVTKKALLAEIIYLMQLELTALSGTNYSGQLAGTLVSDALAATCGFTEPMVEAAYAAIGINNATAAGATVPDFQTRQNSINCIKELDILTLQKMQLYLTCALGVHKAYPQ